jgi:HlyD family secretion protein
MVDPASRRLIFALLAGLLSAMFLAACGPPAPPTVLESMVEVRPIPVMVAAAATGSISIGSSYAATVAAYSSVDVVPLPTGRVEKVLVDVGNEVKKGQVVAELNRGALDAELMAAKANLAAAKGAAGPNELKAQAILEAAKARLDELLNPPADDLKAAESALKAAGTNLETAESGLQRLLNPKMSDIQKAQTAVTTAESRLDSAKTQLEKLHDPLMTNVQVAQSALARAQNNLASAKIKLDEARNPSASNLQKAQSAVETTARNLESSQIRLDEILSPSTGDMASAQRAIQNARARLSNAQNTVNAAIAKQPGTTWQSLLSARTSLQANQGVLDSADFNVQLRPEDIADAREAIAHNQQIIDEIVAAISVSPLGDRDDVSNTKSLIPEDIRAAAWSESEAHRALEAAKESLNDLEDPGPDILVPARNAVAIDQAAYDSARESLNELETPTDRTLSLAQNNVAIAQAAYDSAVETLKELQNPSDSTISVSENDLAIAQAALDAAKANQAELQNPSADVVTKAHHIVDAARAAVDAASARFNRLKSPTAASVAAARAAVASAEQALALSEQSQAQHVIDAAQAKVSQIEERIAETRIVAPFDGYVTKVWVSGGATTIINRATPVVSIVSKNVLVYIQVEETVVGSIEPGQELQFLSPALPGQMVNLKIDNISPAGEQMAHTFTVQLSPVASASALKPGMSGQVFIQTQHDQVLLVPKQAVQRKGTQSTVFVVQDGQARQVQVHLGLIDRKYAEILGGVSPGDEVVVQGQNLLTEEAAAVTIMRN